MKIRILMTAFALACWSLPVRAADFSVKGAGLATCEQMFALVSRSPNLMDSVYVSWMLGFVTGVNSTTAALRNTDSRVAASLELDELRNMLVAGCRENPFKSVFQVATEIVEREARTTKPQ